MIILITIPWFHPAYKAGGPIQSIANMVEQFYEGISYKIFCSNIDLDGSILQVPADTWIKYNEHTEVWYNSKKNTSTLRREIKIIKPDVLFINGIYSLHFNLVPLLFCKASKKILSVRGMLHPGALSQKPVKKKLYLSLLKTLQLHKRGAFHASNEEEKQHVEKIFGKKIKVHVAQNFPRIFTPKPFPEKSINSLQLLSIALVSPMKNHLLVLKALTYCKSNIVYNIYGPIKDKSYWNLCLEQIKMLPKNMEVNYHGYITPAEVENALANNHVFILPSKSENFGHAIFEAFTAGRPVITSNNTPWNNLKELHAGLNVMPEDLVELSNAIQYFAAMDNNEYSQWNKGAKNYSVAAININNIKEEYKKMFFE